MLATQSTYVVDDFPEITEAIINLMQYARTRAPHLVIEIIGIIAAASKQNTKLVESPHGREARALIC